MKNKNKYIVVKLEYDYCIKETELHLKGFSDKIAEHMNEENAKLICRLLNSKK